MAIDLAKELQQAKRDLERAYRELDEAEDKVVECESAVEKARRLDISYALPTPAFLSGLKLILILDKDGEPFSTVKLESKNGEILKEWIRMPSIMDLFEELNALAD